MKKIKVKAAKQAVLKPHVVETVEVAPVSDVHPAGPLGDKIVGAGVLANTVLH